MVASGRAIKAEDGSALAPGLTLTVSVRLVHHDEAATLPGRARRARRFATVA